MDKETAEALVADYPVWVKSYSVSGGSNLILTQSWGVEYTPDARSWVVVENRTLVQRTPTYETATWKVVVV